jgi:hypothetical protein
MKHNFNTCAMVVSHSADVQFQQTYTVGTPAATDESKQQACSLVLAAKLVQTKSDRMSRDFP